MSSSKEILLAARGGDVDYHATRRMQEETLDALANGQQPKTGTQIAGRHTSEPEGGPTTLKEMASSNHDYRKEWGA